MVGKMHLCLSSHHDLVSPMYMLLYWVEQCCAWAVLISRFLLFQVNSMIGQLLSAGGRPPM